MNLNLFQVSLLVRRNLIERAKDFNIILDDVSITDLSFGKDYTAAVEAKQVGFSFRIPLVNGSRNSAYQSNIFDILVGCTTRSPACCIRC